MYYLLHISLGKPQQIDWNKINSNTVIDVISLQNTSQSNLSSVVAQVGNGNNADLTISSKTSIIIQQLGDQNSIYFNNAFTEKETKAAVTVQGYNNVVDITGSNSVSDGMQINVKADNKTVFVRNY
ncbi:hypothetical protein [Chryseobacterium indoltheticum]|uniref:hypothetical protein n=1 Tax=Chryseobacterium indoltheticum TaxID=254 RepID=UPI003F49116B